MNTGEPLDRAAPPGKFRVVQYGGMRGDDVVDDRDYESFDEADAVWHQRRAQGQFATITDDRGKRPVRAPTGKLRAFNLGETPGGSFNYIFVADFASLQEAERTPRRWEYLCDEHGGRPRLQAPSGRFRLIVTSFWGPDENRDGFVLEYETLGDFSSAEEAIGTAQRAVSTADSLRENAVYNDRGERLAAFQKPRG